MPKTVSALSDEDIRRKYYESAGHSMWITEMQLDPLQLIVCDDGTGKYYRVAVALDKGDISFGEPAEVRIQYVNAAARPASGAVVWASREESRGGIEITIPAPPPDPTPAPSPDPAPDAPVAPDVSPAGAAIRRMAAATQTPPAASPAGGSVSPKEQEASGMPFDAAKLREALGLSDTASADDALTAFAGALSALGGGPTPTPADTTITDAALAAATVANSPVKVPQLADGGRPVLLDPDTLTALQNSARKGEVAWAQLRRNERDGVLDTAVRLGKFPASRREYWVQLWDRDPDGTRQAIEALAANVIPVLSQGYLGDDAAQRSASDQAYEGLFGKEG